MSAEITNQLIKNINYQRTGPREIIFSEGKKFIKYKKVKWVEIFILF